MATTKTEITNQALGFVGADQITDFDSDTSTRARLARLYYPGVVHEAFEDFPWTFATKRITLSTAELQDTPAFGYDNAFQLPSDFLTIVDVDPRTADFRIEEDRLLTNESPIGIVYVFDLVDTGKFKAKMVFALALLLAAKLAISINQDLSMAAKLLEMYGTIRNEGQSRDSQEQGRDVEPLDNFITVRSE